MTILQRYVLGEFLKTFLLALVVLTLVFFLGTSLQILRKFKVLEPAFILQVLPHMVLSASTLTLPFSVLVGCTLTFSRLTHDNEITAMRAGGVHFNHIIWPVICSGLLLSLLAFFLSASVVPRAYAQKRALASKAIKLFFSTLVGTEPGTIPYFPGYRIYFSGYRDKKFHDLVIHRIEENKVSEEIMARAGTLTLDEQNLRAQLVLESGSIAHMSYSERQTFYKKDQMSTSRRDDVADWSRALRQKTVWAGFERYVVEMQIPTETGGHDFPKDKTLTLGKLLEWIEKIETEMLPHSRSELAKGRHKAKHGKRPVDRKAAKVSVSYHEKRIEQMEEELLKYRTNLHGRVALSMACLIVVLLGVPLGILVRHSNKLVSFAIAAVPVVGIYYPLEMAGEAIGESGAVHPALAMWGGNVLVGAIGIGLLIWLYRR